MLLSDQAYLLSSLKSLPEENKILLPSQIAEENRYLPRTVTEHPGPYRFDLVPHFREPLNRLHPDDPCTHVSVIKSVQAGATVGILENAMLFWTLNMLGSLAYFTSSKEAGKIRTSSALDILIDNSPLKDYLNPLSDRNLRKTSDTQLYKEIGISKWLITSYNSIAGMKSNTFNLILLDELTEMPPELKDQGSTLGTIEGRTLGTSLYKILAVSTPSRMDTCPIYLMYIQGDQRQYKVPCPHCGEHQILVLKLRGMEHGLTFTQTERGQYGEREIDPKSVRYICVSCLREWFEPQKREAMQKGFWEPTWMGTEYKPVSPLRHSYASSGLMSPFLGWLRLLQAFKKSNFGKNIMEYKQFHINYLGKAYAQSEARANWEVLQKRSEHFEIGKGVADRQRALVVYTGADIQKDRIEMSSLGFDYGMEFYYLDYQVFYGKTENLDDPCWQRFYEYCYDKVYTFGRLQRRIVQVGVDCAYDPKFYRRKDFSTKYNTVVAFCATTEGLCVPVRGLPETAGQQHEMIKGVRSHLPGVPIRYNVSTSMMKHTLMSNLEFTEGPGTIHFPKWVDQERGIPVSDHVFKSFLSEDFREDTDKKFKWLPHYARNEVLDTVVYACGLYYKDSLHVASKIHFDNLNAT